MHARIHMLQLNVLQTILYFHEKKKLSCDLAKMNEVTRTIILVYIIVTQDSALHVGMMAKKKW